MRATLFLAAVGLGAIFTWNENAAADMVLATSGFNDQAGINSNPTPDSPFRIGVTMHNQGVGEPGWDSPWQRIGGFDDRAPVSTDFVYEGDASIKLFADNSFGTSIERPWFQIVPKVRVDAYVLVRPAAQVRGQIVHTVPPPSEIDGRAVARWQVESNGNVSVFDKSVNSWVFTGFQTLPNQWNKYSLIAYTGTQTYQFLFNDQLYNSPHPLEFAHPSLFVDRVNIQALGVLNSYVDAITVIEVPEASSLVLVGVAVAAAALGIARRRRRCVALAGARGC